MGLFKKRREVAALKRMFESPGGQLGAAAAIGDGFRHALAENGGIPPAAGLWVNRFTSGLPAWWADETDKFLVAAHEPAAFLRSEGLLVALLARIARDGANLSEILAAEEAVTLHLTFATIAAAETVRSVSPNVDLQVDDEPPRPGRDAWFSGIDTATWLCCEEIRYPLQNPFLMLGCPADRPDLAYRFIRDQIDLRARSLVADRRPPETHTAVGNDEHSIIRSLRALGGQESEKIDPGPVVESLLQKQTGSWMQNFFDRYPQYAPTRPFAPERHRVLTLMQLGWKIGRAVLADNGALDESYRSEDAVLLADATAARFENLDEASWSDLGRSALALYSGSAVESILNGPDGGLSLQDDHQRELRLLGEAALRYGVACACAEAGVAGL